MSAGLPLRMPYIGLRPFDEPDERLFFGREEQVNEALHRLEDHSFLAVIGASGSGKSSFVRAGLLPAIRDGFLLGTTDWRIIVVKPGHEPYQQLAREIDRGRQHATASDLSSIVALLRNAEQGLPRALRDLRLSPQTRVLVVVDQFEELFGFRRPNARKDEVAARDEAAAFVRMLLQASSDPENALHVAITMRSDFMGDAEAFLGLPEAISRSQFLVPRLTRHQMEDVIVRPGSVAHTAYREFTFEVDLVNRIINDAGDRSDQLPLMQHALMRTWKHAVALNGGTGIVLKHDDYRDAGGIEQALSLHADTAWDRVKDDPKLAHLTKRLFLLLCDVSADGQITRRRPRIEEVRAVTRADTKAIGDVLRIFQEDDRNFLLPPANTRLSDDVVLDISHESLVRQWKRFADWVTDETQSAGTLQRLRERARRWPSEEELLRDPALTVASNWLVEQRPSVEWAARYGGGLDRVREYVAKSEEARRKEKRKEEEAQQRELEEVRQRAAEQAANARRFRWATIAFALLFLLTLGVALYAIRQRNAVQTLSNSIQGLEEIRQQLQSENEGAQKSLEESKVKLESTFAEANLRTAEANLRTAELVEQQQKLIASNATLAKIGESSGTIRPLSGEMVAVTFRESNDSPDAALALLPRAGRVRVIDLSRTRVSDAGLRSLTQLKDLEILDLSFTDIGDSGVTILARMPGLRQLVLNDTMITEKSLPVLGKLTGLRSINLSRTRVNEEVIEGLRRRLTGTTITYQADPFLDALSKSGGNMDEALRAVKGRREETTIIFFSSPITDAALKFLDAERLEFSYCANVTNVGLKHLGRHKSLKSLLLEKGQITDEGIENLIGLPLTRIDLENVAITDRSMVVLGRMRELTSIRIWGTEPAITDKGIAALLPLKGLEDFSLGYTTQTTAATIETLAKIQSLRSLTLSSNFDVPASAYRALKSLPQLQTLDLSYTDAISDANVDDLAQLKQLKNLNVSSTKVTAVGLQQLRAALPTVEFEERKAEPTGTAIAATLRELPTDDRVLTPGVTVSGVLTDERKVFDTSPVQAFSVKGCQGKGVKIELTSSEFDPALAVLRPPPEELTIQDELRAGEPERVSFPCSADDRVIVSSGDDKTGRFQLKLTLQEP